MLATVSCCNFAAMCACAEVQLGFYLGNFALCALQNSDLLIKRLDVKSVADLRTGVTGVHLHFRRRRP